MSTIEKGDELEKIFHQFLLDQKNRGDLVYGAYPPQLCEIHKQKKYYCSEREDYITFDIVVEFFRQESTSPHLFVIFECKNHESSIQEREITDFSDKLGRIFQHAAKGVMVVSSRLQSGAKNVAKKRKMGIVKYDDDGLEIIAERKGGMCAENSFVESQIFKDESRVKSLKFSAYYDGNFFGSIGQLLGSFDPSSPVDGNFENYGVGATVPYVPVELINDSAQEILEQTDYKTGPVDLVKICSMLSIDLQFTNKLVQDADGRPILGSANFDRKSIQINFHDNKNRERFTIGHEIGHFCLGHGRYLRSETIVERDLLINSETENSFNYERLEFQANTFASDLILPKDVFINKSAEYSERLDFKDIGHGYIFVDDQPCNYGPYNQLLSDLSSYFDVSKQAIEIKFKKMGILTDQRKKLESLSFPSIIAKSAFFPRRQ